MLTLLMVSTAVSSVDGRISRNQVCQVGRVALQDLPAFNANRSYTSYYASPDSSRKDLLDVCPELRRLIPAGYPPADDEARKRASIHVPVPGQSNTPGTEIFSIDPPRIASNGKTALVTMRYDCSGLCGGYTEFRYVRTPTGWRQDKPTVILVS